ncbi:MAG: hypothetical protein RLZZ297_1677 [Chloroflexota bacterium]
MHHPPRWPSGYRSAVALAFDMDGPTGDAMLDDSLLDNLRYFTEGSYGPYRAVPRLLDLLAHHGLTITFFIPTWVVEHWPALCERIVRDGHEVAYHGHRHEVFYDLSLADQQATMERSRAIFQRVLGVTPVGFRTPSGDWSPDTAALLRRFGVRYSSSMRGDDRPYFHPDVDGQHGLVEIPARWDMDDYTALALFEHPAFPSGGDRIADYRAVSGNWIAEFSGYHRDGLCWGTILHPKVSCKPGRLRILDELFTAIRRHDDVWVARGDAIAQWWIAQYAEVRA